MKWTIILVLLALIGCTTTHRSIDMDIQEKHESMLYTGVFVDTKLAVGSGVAIQATNGTTLVLTAAHVVADAKKIRVKTYPDEIERPAKLIGIDRATDLALLAFKGEHPYVATIADIVDLQVYEDVWKVGGGGGIDPYPSKGIISSVDDGQFTVSTETTFGDSGGAIYNSDYELIGIISSVLMLNRKTPIYHVGAVVDILSIHIFLTTL